MDRGDEEQPVTQITSVSPAFLYEERYRPCIFWTLILAPCLMPIVWNYHVTVTANELSFGYSCGCSSCTIDRSQILTVEVIPLIKPFLDWGGYGIRKQLPSWETGYIGKKGPGVRITIKDENGKEQAYTFTCDDPEQVVTLLTT